MVEDGAQEPPSPDSRGGVAQPPGELSGAESATPGGDEAVSHSDGVGSDSLDFDGGSGCSDPGSAGVQAEQAEEPRPRTGAPTTVANAVEASALVQSCLELDADLWPPARASAASSATPDRHSAAGGRPPSMQPAGQEEPPSDEVGLGDEFEFESVADSQPSDANAAREQPPSTAALEPEPSPLAGCATLLALDADQLPRSDSTVGKGLELPDRPCEGPTGARGASPTDPPPLVAAAAARDPAPAVGQAEDVELRRPTDADGSRGSSDGEAVAPVDAEEQAPAGPPARGEPPEHAEERQEPDAAKVESRPPHSYATKCVLMLVRCPLTVVILSHLVLWGVCGALYRGGELNTDFASFTRASSPESLNFDALQHAWSSWTPSTERRLQQLRPAGTPRRATEASYIYRGFQVIYSKPGGNVFDRAALHAISQFERKLRALPGWRSMCVGGHLSCDPGETLVTYLWPERPDSNDVNGSLLSAPFDAGTGQRLVLNGSGRRQLPAEVLAASWRGEQEPFERLQRLLPRQFAAPEGGMSASSEMARSLFQFALSFGSSETGAAHTTRSGAQDAFVTFLEDEVQPALVERDEGMESQGMDVFYWSEELDRVDIFDALWTDILLAIGGLLLVLLVVCLHTRSIVLALFGLFLVLESIPVAYIVFLRLSGLPDINIINTISLFVIIGIGSDLIFVLTDGWTLSKGALSAAQQELSGDVAWHEEVQWRLSWLWGNSGASCFVTSACSATSFLVNLGSVLLPLREFGLFMGLCVIFALLLQLTMYPMVLIHMSRRGGRCCGTNSAAVGPHPAAPAPLKGSLAVVPSAEGGDDQFGHERRPALAPQLPSLTRWFAGPFFAFVSRTRIKLLASFFLFAGVGLIGVASSIDMDGGMPALFPDSHNQVAGRKSREQFQDVAAGTVLPSVLHNAWLCNVTSGHTGGICADWSEDCGTMASHGECGDPAAQQLCQKTCGLCAYCLSLWCQVDEPPATTLDLQLEHCDCYEEGLPDGDAAVASAEWPDETAVVETLVVGRNASSWEDLKPWLEVHIGAGEWADGVPEQRAPLTQEHWSSGDLAVWQTFAAPTYRRRPSRAPAAAAAAAENATGTPPPASNATAAEAAAATTIRQFCYCNGVRPCSSTRSVKRRMPLAGYSGVLDFVPSAPPRRAAMSGRAPAVATAGETIAVQPPHLGRRLTSTPAVCSIIWGLTVRDLGALDLFVQTDVQQMWDFDPTFDASDPWAQRSMMRMVQDLPAELKVQDTHGWLQHYEKWLVDRGGPFSFPSRHFDATLGQFLGQFSDYASWLLIEGSRVKAARMDFTLSLNELAAVGVAIEAQFAWDDYVEAWNSEASVHAGRAWHASSLWVRAQAQDGIISSTALTVAISVLVGFLAMVVFACDCLLACLSMVSSVLTIVSLLFVMVVCMQWTIGAIEVVALIVFLGYLFSFNLHMSHAYKHAQVAEGSRRAERRRRVQEALRTMGRSLLGSSVTSAGCAVFLLFCTLQFFVRFGIVILSVTFLSLLYSLVLLPALLLTVGPTSRGAAQDDVLEYGTSKLVDFNTGSSGLRPCEAPQRPDEDEYGIGELVGFNTGSSGVRPRKAPHQPDEDEYGAPELVGFNTGSSGLRPRKAPHRPDEDEYTTPELVVFNKGSSRLRPRTAPFRPDEAPGPLPEMKSRLRPASAPAPRLVGGAPAGCWGQRTEAFKAVSSSGRITPCSTSGSAAGTLFADGVLSQSWWDIEEEEV